MACINHEVKIKKLEKHKGNVEERAHGLYKSMRITQAVYKLKTTKKKKGANLQALEVKLMLNFF